MVFLPLSTLRCLLVYPKDPLPVCDGCPKVYIGQTYQSLKHQLVEHRNSLKNGDVAASALAEHAVATGHLVDFTSLEVIDYHPPLHDAFWRVGTTQPNTLNEKKGTLPEV